MTNSSRDRLIFSENELKHKHIIYGGDSFIWGEGLELYIDTPFWINERNNHNEWEQLFTKQTNESHSFRNKNRFPGIIESITGYKQIVDPMNGGDYQSSTDIVNYNLRDTTAAIVYQFTQIDRNFLHSTIKCECGFCGIHKPKPFNVYMDYMSKVINNEPIPKLMQSQINYLEEYENIKKFTIEGFESSGMDFSTYIDSLFNNIRKKNIDYLIENNIKKWQKTHKVYLIDSWCQETSNNYVNTHPYLVDLLIPLKGYDGKWYTNYPEWERTFPYSRIMYQYSNTVNGHPTPLQHQYLAESIITALKKDKII
jgi:hypothetical protein